MILTQRFETTYASRPNSDKDIVLVGNGLTVYWKNPNPLTPNTSQVNPIPPSV